MARITKADHARILHLIEEEGRKVADVAAEYGCAPANIYGLLARLRREPAKPEGEVQPEDADIVPPEVTLAASLPAETVGQGAVFDLFAAASVELPPPAIPTRTPRVAATKRAAAPSASGHVPVQVPVQAVPQATHQAPSPPPAEPTPPQAPPSLVPSVRPASGPSLPTRPARAGGKSAKPGVGLVMRTSDDEETVTPFRSLDDLLSAVKPMLRAAARSSDTVWFSIQPIDLASLDSDAA